MQKTEDFSSKKKSAYARKSSIKFPLNKFFIDGKNTSLIFLPDIYQALTFWNRYILKLTPFIFFKLRIWVNGTVYYISVLLKNSWWWYKLYTYSSKQIEFNWHWDSIICKPSKKFYFTVIYAKPFFDISNCITTCWLLQGLQKNIWWLTNLSDILFKCWQYAENIPVYTLVVLICRSLIISRFEEHTSAHLNLCW